MNHWERSDDCIIYYDRRLPPFSTNHRMHSLPHPYSHHSWGPALLPCLIHVQSYKLPCVQQKGACHFTKKVCHLYLRTSFFDCLHLFLYPFHHSCYSQAFPNLDLGPIQGSIQVESGRNECNVRKRLWGILKSQSASFSLLFLVEGLTPSPSPPLEISSENRLTWLPRN